jgi:hypothetical protein
MTSVASNTAEPPIRHFIESPPERAVGARENPSEQTVIVSRDSDGWQWRR